MLFFRSVSGTSEVRRREEQQQQQQTEARLIAAEWQEAEALLTRCTADAYCRGQFGAILAELAKKFDPDAIAQKIATKTALEGELTEILSALK